MWRTLIIVCVLIIVLGCVDGRGGGRGGGGRGGSRGGSRSRSGSSRSSRSSVRTYRGPVYSSSSWKTAAAAGTLYGVMSYKRRHLYRDHPDKEPRVCFNQDNLKNGTYGYFICPEPDQPDDHSYCCGDDNEQRCCTYSEYKKAQIIGAIVGGVIGGVVLIAFVVGFTVFCCCVKKRQTSRRANGGKVLYNGNTQSVTTTSTAPPYSSNVYSTPASYGLPSNDAMNADTPDTKEPIQPPAYGFKDDTTGLPYSSNPQTGEPADPNARPPPYGTSI